MGGFDRFMNTNDDPRTTYVNEAKALRDKSNQLASMHSWLSDNYRRYFIWVSSLLLFISSLLLGFSFVSEDFVERSINLSTHGLKWIIGIISILNFSGILILSQLDFQSKAASHREAVRFYFSIVNKIRGWFDRKQEITFEMMEEIRDEYSRTEALPKIPDNRFLQLKQWHLQKIAVSKELDKTPFKSIKDIRKSLEK